jgi:hypothetical protein
VHGPRRVGVRAVLLLASGLRSTRVQWPEARWPQQLV